MSITVTAGPAPVDAARHTRDFEGELRVERGIIHGLVDTVTAPLSARTRAAIAQSILSAVPEGQQEQFAAALVKLGDEWRLLLGAGGSAGRQAFAAVYALASEAAQVQVRGLRALFGGAR